jgi:hypothetical protein
MAEDLEHRFRLIFLLCVSVLATLAGARRYVRDGTGWPELCGALLCLLWFLFWTVEAGDFSYLYGFHISLGVSPVILIAAGIEKECVDVA